MTTRKALIAVAITWIDVPAIDSGAQRVGCNCLGLHVGYLREIGGFEKLVLEAEKHVGMKGPVTPNDLMKKLVQSAHVRNIRPIKLEVGNLVLFFTRVGPQHLTLITEPGMVLHAAQIKGKVVQHFVPRGWRPAAEFEFVGIED